MSSRFARAAIAAAAFTVASSAAVFAAPYAGEVSVSGTAGSFVLNEAADTVSVIYDNGASSQVIDGSAAGSKSFTLPSAGSTYKIVVTKNSAPGWLSGQALQIGTDTTSTTFNSPRGVTVNQNPGQYFGRVYVANSAAGSTTSAGGVARTAGDGIYVLHADQTDGVGQGDTARDGGLTTQFTTGGVSIPFRLSVASDNNLYITDFSNAFGNIYRTDANVSAGSGTVLLSGYPAASTATADTLNHGNSSSKPVVSISPTNQVSIYAVDELLGAPGTTNNPGATAKYNSIVRYDLGTSPAAGNLTGPASPLPATIISSPSAAFSTLANVVTFDLAQGPTDKRFYYLQNRSAGNETGLYVVDPTDGSILFDSLAVTRSITGVSTSQDRVQAVNGVVVSPDNKYLAFIDTSTNAPNATGNALVIIPLTATIGTVSGLPDLSSIITITNAFPNTTGNGRDIAFDAAGNLYAVSSGEGMMRVFSPGGTTSYTTAFDGTNFTFGVTPVPEPVSASLLGAAAIGLVLRRRRSNLL